MVRQAQSKLHISESLVRCKKSKPPRFQKKKMVGEIRQNLQVDDAMQRFADLDKCRYMKLKIKIHLSKERFVFIRERAGSKYADMIGLMRIRYEIRYEEMLCLLLQARFETDFKQLRPSSSGQTFLQTLLLLPSAPIR